MNAIGPSDGDPTTSSAPESGHATDRARVLRAETHEEIVRVLIINQRGAPEGFTGLEHLRRSDVAQRERFERQHRRHDDAFRARPRAVPWPSTSSAIPMR